jgi:hypothetical protein
MIVIPMAGASRRFTEAGYARPKYELPLNGRPVFDHAVQSFRAQFDREAFLFVVLGEAAEAYVAAACARLGLADVRIARLNAPTAGQAQTVALGLAAAAVSPVEPLTIFNIDTFRPGYVPLTDDLDGWLEVFRGAGANWSYVRPGPNSDLCCNGLYHFARAADFLWALEQERAAPTMPELYVAPLYNPLIRAGRRIGYRLIQREDVVFCGTPEEYRAIGG